jgi:hypothetical protein
MSLQATLPRPSAPGLIGHNAAQTKINWWRNTCDELVDRRLSPRPRRLPASNAVVFEFFDRMASTGAVDRYATNALRVMRYPSGTALSKIAEETGVGTQPGGRR